MTEVENPMRKSPRVLIVNVWSDKNRGDSIITLNTVYLLKRFFPESKIMACSLIGFNEINAIKDEDLSRTSRIVLSVLGNFFPSSYLSTIKTANSKVLASPSVSLRRIGVVINRLVKVFYGVVLLFLSFSHLIKYIKHLFPSELKRTIDGFLWADFVVIKGGGYLKSTKISDIYGIFFYLYPALFSMALKKPYVFLGHSIWDIEHKFSRFLFGFIARKAILLTLREKYSYVYMRKFGLKNIKCLPDLAFLKTFSPKEVHQTDLVFPKPLIGVTVRNWHFPKSNSPQVFLEKYIAAIITFINYVVEHGYSVLIIPHTITKLNIGENDMVISRLIADRTRSSHVRLLDTSKMSIEELFGVYSRLDLLVATRTHSAIFALHAGVPTILISYSGPKALGIMERLGLEDYVLDIYTISFESLVESFVKLWKEKEKVRRKVLKFMPKLHKETLLHGVYLKKWYESCLGNRVVKS